MTKEEKQKEKRRVEAKEASRKFKESHKAESEATGSNNHDNDGYLEKAARYFGAKLGFSSSKDSSQNEQSCSNVVGDHSEKINSTEPRYNLRNRSVADTSKVEEKQECLGTDDVENRKKSLPQDHQPSETINKEIEKDSRATSKPTSGGGMSNASQLYSDAVKSNNGGENQNETVEAVVNEPLKEAQRKPEEDDIEVRFEVLMLKSMALSNGSVCIVFGPPLSDWETIQVRMTPKPKKTIKDQNYTFLSGILSLPRNFQSKTLPYKYILSDGSQTIWEHIQVKYTDLINRCLVVPSNVTHTFIKFDDVILNKFHDNSEATKQQKIGREVATRAMLPQFDESEDFDFQSALKRFEGVIKAHGPNGMKICKGDVPCESLNPVDYKISKLINEHIDGLFKEIQTIDNIQRKFVRLIYLTLLRKIKSPVQIDHVDQLLKLSIHFKDFIEILLQTELLKRSISDDLRLQVSDALKQLVQDFINVKRGTWTDWSNFGNWIYIVPFIHFFDESEKEFRQWFPIRNWKEAARSRLYDNLQHLDFIQVASACDDKITGVFLLMLERSEMVRLLTKSDDSTLMVFSPVQLLQMLQGITSESCLDLSMICMRIRTRLLNEIQDSQKTKDTNEWISFMKSITRQRLPVSAKYDVITVFLDILKELSSFVDSQELLHEIAQVLATDNATNQSFSRICTMWSAVLPKIKELDFPVHSSLLAQLQARVSGEDPEICFEIFLVKAPELSKEISDLLFTRGSKLLQEKNVNLPKRIWNNVKSWAGYELDAKASNLARFFEKSISDFSCDRSRGCHEVACTVTEFPAVINLMKCFSFLREKNLLSRDVVDKTVFILQQIWEFCNCIRSGSVSFEAIVVFKDKIKMENLISLHDCFIDCFEKYSPVQELRNLIVLRLEEIDAFFGTKKDFEEFASQFTAVQIKNHSVLQEILNQFHVNGKETDLSSIFYCRLNGRQDISFKFKNITKKNFEIVSHHTRLFNKSSVFRKLHSAVISKELLKDEEIEVQDSSDDKDLLLSIPETKNDWTVMISLAEMMITRFEKFVADLSHLNTTVYAAQDYFQTLHQEKRLHKELQVLANSSDNEFWLNTVEETLERLFTVNQYSEAAKAVRVASTSLGIITNFQVIDRIMNSANDFGDQPLKSVGDDLIQAGKVFQEWAKKEIEVLLSLDKCGTLLKWLKDNIRDRGDLRTFYDLAMISAGESDLELDRVSHFYQAVNAYSPLLFDLQPKSTSFKEFLDACQKVFAALKNDPTIASKLVDSSNRNLEWIKACKDHQGSVEQSSLTMVSKINETGLYTISHLGKKSSRPRVEDCVKLKYDIVTRQESLAEDDSQMQMNLEELQELRSKLVLITAGTEGKKDVERFVRILNLVELAAEQLINLLLRGCHLFSDWTLQVFCKPEKKISVQARFGHSGGLMDGETEVELELEKIINFLKDALEEWTRHVFRLRNDSSSLNFFTTDQLVLLSQQLAHHVYEKMPISTEASMLLRLLCPSASEKRLSDVIRKSVREHQNNGEEPGHDSLDESSSEDDEDAAEIHTALEKSLENPLDHLRSSEAFQCLKNDFEEELVLAAIIKCGAHSDNLILDWCVENEENKENYLQVLEDYSSSHLVRPKDSKEPKAVVLKPQRRTPEKMSLHALFGSLQTSGMLCEKLANIWKKFLDRVNDLCITDFLSFKALAYCLEKLSAAFGSQPQRRFSSNFSEGNPNLVICPESDIHTMALTIFMEEQNKPLPGLDEVLICDKNTQKEQIELLCRRAFNDQSGKIFVLVHAERMNYDVGIHIENVIMTTTVSNNKYRLVFIASKEKNDHSYIITAFEKYRRPMTAVPFASRIRKYLLKHFENRTNFDPNSSTVRIVRSTHSGNGKSLVVKRLRERHAHSNDVTVQLHDNEVNFSNLISTCLQRKKSEGQNIFHIDVAPAVLEGRDDLIFSVSVLGGLVDSSGHVWLRSECDYILFELTGDLVEKDNAKENEESTEQYPFINFVPAIHCESPEETAQRLRITSGEGTTFLRNENGDWIHLFDHQIFESEVFQRPYIYLQIFSNPNSGVRLDDCYYSGTPTTKDFLFDCLDTLIRHCSIENPTWLELTHFASFLNTQLRASENSIFCNADLMKEDFPGMKTFVVKFLIQMSKDFATRSVEISDQSHGEGFSKPRIRDRKRWENSPHPYIFFNDDGHSMLFYGFKLDGQFNLIDERSNHILERQIMSRALYDGLLRNFVVFNQSFDSKSEKQKLSDLCMILGVQPCEQNPDRSYELTSDNMMKMLAIQMRFRSNIPVVIMGETGSGKTRLVRFMCDVMRQGKRDENLMILKTHGGIEESHIFAIVEKAIAKARRNTKLGIKQTVLFFDEANTTNAIGVIKNVMCDRLLNGQPIPSDIGLQFVAAVNPYREHSNEMIQKLEQAGLGYHIRATDTQDKIGRIPLRRLVYRVKEIPASMFPLIWDFGILDDETEKKYIVQMITNRRLPHAIVNLLVEVLSRSQRFMRQWKDECSFVSLRDVERMLTIYEWFQAQEGIISKKVLLKMYPNSCGNILLLQPTVNLILALGVSYYTRLDFRRKEYEDEMTRCLSIEKGFFSDIIVACQDLFIDELTLEQNIAKNDALKENVWMMAICIELRIPLFLVGKPGSSKSLSKTVVTDVMQGDSSYSKELFKHLKEIHMVSFQCSPLATAGGILSTFRQCQKFQEKRDLNRFTAVCVLDEVGLAEDSPKMPLKALHPLLEDGCVDTEEPSPSKKVSFIGISNWALDPAKMNRGILLSRGIPTLEDLVKSAKGICARDKDALSLMDSDITNLAQGYSEIYKVQEREYFGLRDFYSLVKMVYSEVQKHHRRPDDEMIVHSIQRNFGGYFGKFKPTEVFLKKIYPHLSEDTMLPPKELILKAIRQEGETRYILLLTKNNAALTIIQEQNLVDMTKTRIIFGSSFQDDQEYRQICLNINKIKVAMETGQTVILCNLNNLYESLYDALNQNYVTMGDQRYVDLGLGTHRVKCRVHQHFRLILIAEDTDVYEKFPIPLINRLEKHYLGMETMISEDWHQRAVKSLKQWVFSLSEINWPLYKRKNFHPFVPSDVIIGYHDDAAASIVLRLEKEGIEDTENVVDCAKSIFLECTTPDGISRLSETLLSDDEKQKISRVFYSQQKNSLAEAVTDFSEKNNLIQVTTFSRLLTASGVKDLRERLDKSPQDLFSMNLTQISTEEQFSKRIGAFLACCNDRSQKVLIVQAQLSPKTPSSLIECTRYAILNQAQQCSHRNFCILLVIQVPRVRGGFFTGFPGSQWKALHIDELCGDPNNLKFAEWNGKTIHEVLSCDPNNCLGKLIDEAIPKASNLAHKNSLCGQRVTECVRLLKQTLSSDKEFVKIVNKLVLDRVKDEQSQLPNAEKWMAELSIRSIHLKEGNTFVRAVWMDLVDRVAKHLAKIIITCDRYDGLTHLDNQTDWKYHLYKQLLPAVDNDAVLYDARSSFESALPFSWAVKDLLEKLDQGEIDQLEIAFNSTDVGKITSHFCDEYSNIAPRLLLLDFFRLEFGHDLPNETTDLLCQKIFNLTKLKKMKTLKEQMMDVDETGDQNWNFDGVALSPTDIHETLMTLKPRLAFSASLLKLNPRAASRINMVGEIYDIDIQVLLLLFDIYEINESKVIIESSRGEWISAVSTLTTFLKQLKGLLVNSDLSENCKNLLQASEKKSLRAEIIKLLLENVMHQDVPVAIQACVCKKLRVLWARLKEVDFERSPKYFDLILKFIETSCIEASKTLLVGNRGLDVCVVCKEAIEEPVILPCNHIGCEYCLKNYFEDNQRRYCPGEKCKELIPESFQIKPSVDVTEAVKQHAILRSKMSDFFINLLHGFVFQSRRLPHQNIVDNLLKFIVTKELPKDEKCPRTKSLTPFPGDYIDSKPVIRSFILKLLFRFQLPSVETYFQKYLDEKKMVFANFEAGETFNELCCMVVQCLEDSILSSKRSLSKEAKMSEAIRHMEEQLNSNEHAGGENLVKNLFRIATDRLTLNTIAEVLESCLTNPTDVENFMSTAENFVSNHAQSLNCQKYLLRVIAFKYQVGQIIEWKKRGIFTELLPESVKNSNVNELPDMYLTIDPDYKHVRDAIRLAWIDGDYSECLKLAVENKRVLWALAFHHVTNVNPARPKDKETFETFLKKIMWIDKIWKQTNENHFKSLINRTARHSSLHNLMVHLQEVTTKQKATGFLSVLTRLSLRPEGVSYIYLPTMPHDETVEAKNAVRDATRWYQCPNGHAYAIGDCGQPVIQGTCPSCKAPVGGTGYAFYGTGRNAQQTAGAEFRDETKTGHVLGRAKMDEPSLRVRHLGACEVAIVRFLLHSAMLLGCQKNPKAVAKMIDPNVPEDFVDEFITEHLLLNLRQISNSLGKNEEAVVILLHHVFNEMGKNHQVGNHDGTLTTKAAVIAWEETFDRLFIKKLMPNLDALLESHRLAVEEDRQEASNAIQEIIHEEVTQDEVNPLNSTRFWIPREGITIGGIETKVGAKRLKDHCPMLLHLLNNEKILETVSKLPNLLRLWKFVVKKLNRKVEMNEADKMTVRKFITDLHPDERKTIKPIVEDFIKIFNKIKRELFAANWVGRKIEEMLGGYDLTPDSPSSVLFPASLGFGLASSALMQLLLDAHNSCVKKFVDEKKVPVATIMSVDDIFDTSMLVTVNSSDLHLALIANSEYDFDVGAGTRTQWKLNDDGLEQTVIEKFVSGRPKIDVNSVPRFEYQDQKIGSVGWRQLKEKIGQFESLPSAAVRLQLEADLPEIRDVVSLMDILATTADTLVIVGGEADQELFATITKLQIGALTRKQMKCIDHFKVGHIEPLMFHLRYMRASRMVTNNQSPFVHVNKTFFEELPEQSLTALNKALHHYEPDVIGRELLDFIHQFIEDIIDDEDDGFSERKFSDYFFSYLDEKGFPNAFKFSSYFEESLKIKHCGSMFFYVIKKSQERFF